MEVGSGVRKRKWARSKAANFAVAVVEPIPTLHFPAGVSVDERRPPSTQRGLFATNTKAFDISSKLDFPPMGMAKAPPGKNRAVGWYL